MNILLLIGFIVLSTTNLLCAEGASVVPTREELRLNKIGEVISTSEYIASNTVGQPFVIWECKARNSICYLFRSERVSDIVCSSAEEIPGQITNFSRKEVLEFFAIRFRGIANDLAHQKWRVDVLAAPVNADQEKSQVLLAITYNEYARSLEGVLAKDLK